MAPTNHPGTPTGTLPGASNHPVYRPNNATYSTLAELVAPYSLSRIQLTEAVGIATKPTVNTWVKQCCPNLPQGAPVP
ncbi:MAG: glycosyltransferase, partial [Rothia sp.]|nr:glycosyltransferase [Rothia sp. (in: high G+C Gram-positive bacteria)]